MRTLFKQMIAALTVCTAAWCPSVASAAVVTFDDTGSGTGAPFSSGGLDFSGSFTYVWFGPGYNADNGTNSLISGFSTGFTITKTGGGLFSIDQLDAGLSWYTGLTSLNISVGSDVISLGQSYQTYSFTNINNVTSVTVAFAPGDGYFAIDNIVWNDNPVPEPGSLTLLGLALLGLVAARRRNLLRRAIHITHPRA